jgi:toxin ParE1/3/4
VKIRYRPNALAQLDNIFAYIAVDSQPSAHRVIARIKHSIDQLADFPYSGRPSEIADIRELPVVRYPYIVFYTVDAPADEVLVLRVRHTSQDPTHHFDD